jgi:hypothetical protein
VAGVRAADPSVIRWLFTPWRAWCRQIDLWLLWPTCKRLAPDLNSAKASFYWHVSHDRTWTDDYSSDIELRQYVDTLK